MKEATLDSACLWVFSDILCFKCLGVNKKRRKIAELKVNVLLFFSFLITNFAHEVSLIEMHQRQQQQQQPYHQSTVINGLQAQYYRQYPAEHLIWYPKLWCQQHEVNCLIKKITTMVLVQIKMIMEELVVFKVELKFNILIIMLRYFKIESKNPITFQYHYPTIGNYAIVDSFRISLEGLEFFTF